MMFKLPSLIKRKRHPNLVKLIDIPARDINDMDIMTYIIYLWEYKDMHHIGYIISKANERHCDRWVLYAYSDKRIAEYNKKVAKKSVSDFEENSERKVALPLKKTLSTANEDESTESEYFED